VRVQAECIKLFYERTMDMWQEAKTNPRLRNKLRRPAFSICVLYVDEEVSLAATRQLLRHVPAACSTTQCASFSLLCCRSPYAGS